MTWELWAIVVAWALGVSTGWLVGHRRGEVAARREGVEDGLARGRLAGLVEAHNTAKAALDAPSNGKPGRSIVGRAIVRKLRALAEGTGTNTNGATE